MNYIEEYYSAILSQQVIVSKRIKRQYEKLVDDIQNPNEYHFDETRANRPIEFIERFCKHSKGEWAGQAVKLELFQKAFISALFGFVDSEGKRKYKESLFYVARKNGKSTLLAGISLYCLCADGEAGAEVYSVATKKDQAALIFNEAVNMVKQSKDLLQNIKKRKTDLYFGLTFSLMKPLGKNSDTLDGLNSSLVIVDELHSIKDRNLYEVMKQSQSARRQPLLISITTAGTIRETIFDDLYKYACGVCDETIEDKNFLPIIYELDNREEWTQPQFWQKANPALGSIKKIEDLTAKVKRALQSPRDLTGVLVKDFNIIENQAQSWLLFEDVDNRATFDLKDFKGKYFLGGVDLSRTDDLTAAAILIIDEKGNKYTKVQAFLPADGFDKRCNEDRAIPYKLWQEQGILKLSAGNVVNYEDITKWYIEIVEQFDLTPAYIFYDPYSAIYLINDLEKSGFRCEKIYQNSKLLSPAMQMLESDLKQKKLNYNNSPLVKWCLCNLGCKEDDRGNLQPVKANGSRNKIDAAMAILDAYAGLILHHDEIMELAKNS